MDVSNEVIFCGKAILKYMIKFYKDNYSWWYTFNRVFMIIVSFGYLFVPVLLK